MVKYLLVFAAWIKILHSMTANCEHAGVTKVTCSYIDLSTSNDLCVVKWVEEPTFPDEDDETSPPPLSFKANWFIQKRRENKNVSVIGLNMSWSQEVTVFKEVVTGYQLSLWETGVLQNNQIYLVTFPNRSRIIDLIEDTSKKVEFIFSDIGLFQDIRPQETSGLDLYSLPMFHDNTDPVYAFCMVPIPGCEESEHLHQTENCKNYISDEEFEKHFYIREYEIPSPSTRPQKTADKIFENKRVGAPAVAVAASVSSAVTFIVFIVIMLLWIGHQKKKNLVLSKKIKRKEVLFVVDVGLEEERSAYHETAGRLASILQRHGGIKVKCSLWHISTISDPHLWLVENMKTADYVVLFLTPLKRKFISESNWISFLSAFSHQGFCIKPKSKMNDKVFLVHITDKPNYQLPESYKTYQITSNFDKFFKDVTGKSVSKHIPKNAVQNLQQMAFLESIV